MASRLRRGRAGDDGTHAAHRAHGKQADDPGGLAHHRPAHPRHRLRAAPGAEQQDAARDGGGVGHRAVPPHHAPGRVRRHDAVRRVQAHGARSEPLHKVHGEGAHGVRAQDGRRAEAEALRRD